MSDSIVRVEDVDKSFDGDTALAGVDLNISRDETTLLLGPNGSGKTILLSCIAGGLTPSSGEISVFDCDPSDASPALTFMLQDSLAFPNLTGRETIEFYADLHPHTTDEWRDLAARLGIENALDKQVNEYSGGMVRKLELVVTFMTDVPLYLLDEPTAELDMTTVDTVHSIIEERREAGSTVVVSSHLPVDIQLADRVTVIREGELVTTGRPADLMADVPSVVAVDSTASPTELRDCVRAGRLFEQRDSARGFLRNSVDRELVRAHGGVVESPSVVDLFNYYVHVLPET
ncbi:ABC transporter ATP-binding protein [Halobacterium zhouii]|uniref:ABC transporter ATP-binding protein n=1 Tax=Halobacterium zhouii TaxID=2902624 RepID=UPI001E5C821B|nr:ABC transporter ATP-binding protein [Halobacterium zhouii]